MLMVSTAIVCLADLLAWAQFRASLANAAARALQAVGPATTVALLAFMVVRVAQEKSAYDQSVPLGIHESSRLRLPERQVAGIRWLVANINHSCDTFLCPIGFHSLYLWTDKEPPSRIILGHVLSLFTQAEQQALLDSIEAAPHSLIVDHEGLFSGLEAKDVPGATRAPCWMESPVISSPTAVVAWRDSPSGPGSDRRRRRWSNVRPGPTRKTIALALPYLICSPNRDVPLIVSASS